MTRRTDPERKPVDERPEFSAGELLALWRAGPVLGIPPQKIAALGRLISERVLVHDRLWPCAVRDDVPAAIGVAFRVLDAAGPSSPAADIAMSALLVHAARRDPAASLVLHHAVEMLAGRRNARGEPTPGPRRDRGA